MSSDFEVPGTTGRPTSVNIAVYMQFAIGALGVIACVVSVIQTADTTNRMREAIAGVDMEGGQRDELEAFVGLFGGLGYTLAIVSLLFAAAVAILGIFNRKGKNGTRIATWVLAGLGLACGVCGSVAGALGGLSEPPQSSGDELTEAITQATMDLPAWYSWVGIAFTVLDVVLYLAIIILLAVPASNDFFRKPKPEMDITLPPEAYMDAPPPPAAPAEPAGDSSEQTDKDEPEKSKDEPGQSAADESRKSADEPDEGDFGEPKR